MKLIWEKLLIFFGLFIFNLHKHTDDEYCFFNALFKIFDCEHQNKIIGLYPNYIGHYRRKRWKAYVMDGLEVCLDEIKLINWHLTYLVCINIIRICKWDRKSVETLNNQYKNMFLLFWSTVQSRKIDKIKLNYFTPKHTLEEHLTIRILLSINQSFLKISVQQEWLYQRLI